MGGIFGGGGSTSSGSGIAKMLREQRDKMYGKADAYNALAAPFFDLALNRGKFGESFYPMLADRIQNPTLSPAFKLYAKEGLDTLRSNYATTGSPSSGPAQIAGGRFLEGLAANQLERTDNMLMNAANFQGQLPVTQEPAYLGLGAQLAMANGQARAAANANSDSGGFGGLFGNIIGSGIGSFFGAGGKISSRDFKNIKEEISTDEALAFVDCLESLPIYRWQYKPGIADGAEHVGPVVEEMPADMVKGKMLDDISTLGVLMLAVKTLSARIKALEAKNA